MADAYDTANLAYQTANDSYTHANAAFVAANNAQVYAENVEDFAFLVYDNANVQYQLNNQFITSVNANTFLALATANATAANLQFIQNDPVFTYGIPIGQGAYNQANAAWDTANAVSPIAIGAYGLANTINAYVYEIETSTIGIASFENANASFNLTNISINVAYYAANLSNSISANISGYGELSNITNAAFAQANDTSGFVSLYVNPRAIGALESVNTLSSFANTVSDTTNAAYQLANITYMQIAETQTSTIAQSAYAFANSLNVTLSNTIELLTITNDKADGALGYAAVIDANATAAFDFANTVNSYVYSITSGDLSASVNTLFDVANTTNASILNSANDIINVSSFSADVLDVSNASYNVANVIYTVTNAAFGLANTLNTTLTLVDTNATAAFAFANSVNNYAGSLQVSISNLSNTTSNGTLFSANLSNTVNAAFSLANTASQFILEFRQPNTAIGAFELANTLNDSYYIVDARVNAVSNIVNTLNTFSYSAYELANNAYNYGNTLSGIVSLFDSNSINTLSNSVNTLNTFAYGINANLDLALITANTAANTINAYISNVELNVLAIAVTTAAFNKANDAYDIANNSILYANDAYNLSTNVNTYSIATQANLNNLVLYTANVNAFAYLISANVNTAIDFTETVRILADDANTKAYDAYAYVETVNTFAYSVNELVNTAFISSNTVNAFAYNIDSNVQNLTVFTESVSGVANAAYDFANTIAVESGSPIFAFGQANAAFDRANAVYDIANTGNVALALTIANSALANVTGAVFEGNLIVTGSVSDAKGDVRNINISSQANDYVLVISDTGKIVGIDTASANVYVPPSVFSSGNVISLYNNTSTSITLIGNSGVTLRLAGTTETGNRTLSNYGLATIICVNSTSNTFIVSGSGLY